MIPIGDEPNERLHAPFVNYALIGVNAVVFLLMRASVRGDMQYEAVLETWGYTPAAPTLLTLFTSMFMHANFMHLGGNMLFLWVFGDNVEARLGSLGYLAAYLATGAAATLAFSAGDSSSVMPLVGASGAISGVEGIYFLWFPQNRVKLLTLFFFYPYVMRISARWIIGFWFVLQDLLPVIGVGLMGRGDAGDGVAHLAHLGGFASGFVLAFVLARVLKDWVPLPPAGPYGTRDPSVATASPTWGDSGFPSRPSKRGYGTWSGSEVVEGATEEETVLALWRGGRYQQAADVFAKALSFGREPRLPEAEMIRMAVWLYDGARFDDARRAFEAFLHHYAQSRNAPAAHFGLGMILSRRDGDAANARAHLSTAFQTHPDPQVRDLAHKELARLDTMRS